MLPATNKGVGMNIGFPDVCNTFVGVATSPIPYASIAFHFQAVPFSLRVKITMMSALTKASKITMSTGDESAAGCHPTIKGMSTFRMGSLIVKIDRLSAIHLLCPTTSNNMNCQLGAVLVPSLTNVFFTSLAAAPEAIDRPVSLEQIEGLRRAAGRESLGPDGVTVDGSLLESGVGYIKLRVFTFDAPTLVHNEIRRLQTLGMTSLVLDLRDNPGGETDAFMRLADDFLEQGQTVIHALDGDGDLTIHRARQADPYDFPVALLVDGMTASAAELFAGILQHHRRAVVVGQTTHGKRTAQQLLPHPDGGGAVYATVARYTLPDGRSLDGLGVRPDVVVEGEDEPGLDVALRSAVRSVSAL